MCFVWLSTLEVHIHKHIHINIILWWTRIINSLIFQFIFLLLKIYFILFYFPKQAPHRAQWFVFNKTADSRLISKFIVAFTKCTTRRISILFFIFVVVVGSCCWEKCACISKNKQKKKKKLREFIFRKLFCSVPWMYLKPALCRPFCLVGCWTLILQAQCDRFRPKLLFK